MAEPIFRHPETRAGGTIFQDLEDSGARSADTSKLGFSPELLPEELSRFDSEPFKKIKPSADGWGATSESDFPRGSIDPELFIKDRPEGRPASLEIFDDETKHQLEMVWGKRDTDIVYVLTDDPSNDKIAFINEGADTCVEFTLESFRQSSKAVVEPIFQRPTSRRKRRDFLRTLSTVELNEKRLNDDSLLEMKVYDARKTIEVSSRPEKIKNPKNAELARKFLDIWNGDEPIELKFLCDEKDIFSVLISSDKTGPVIIPAVSLGRLLGLEMPKFKIRSREVPTDERGRTKNEIITVLPSFPISETKQIRFGMSPDEALAAVQSLSIDGNKRSKESFKSVLCVERFHGEEGKYF